MKKPIFLFALIFSFSVMAQEETSGPVPIIIGSPQDETEKVKVFPNPATYVVNVLGLKNSPNSNINITDVYGNTVASHQWEIKNNSVNLPVSALDPGMYVITIRSSEQNIRVKFLKK